MSRKDSFLFAILFALLTSVCIAMLLIEVDVDVQLVLFVLTMFCGANTIVSIGYTIIGDK